MADGMDEGMMEEGTYPKQKGKPKGKGNNGGIVDEMCNAACAKGKKMNMSKGKGMKSWQG